MILMREGCGSRSENDFHFSRITDAAPALISVTIPALNRYDLVRMALASLFAQTDQNFEVLLVDNGSEPGEVEKLADYSNDSRLHLILLGCNTGFAPAVNVGIQASQGELIVLLNNDVVLEPDWLENVRKTMAQHPDWLHAATKIRQYHRPELLDDVGNILLPTGRAVKMGYAERDEGQYDAPHTVFSACGAAAVYRKTFFEQVGLFDEDFFAYLEDVDLGFRAQRMGFVCGWIPNAVCRHIGSATTGSMKNTFTVRLLARNQVCMLVKNFPATLWMLLGIPIGCTMLAQWFKYVCDRNGNGEAFREGLISGIKQIGKMRRKRLTAKATWKQTSLDLLKQLVSGGRLYRTSKKNRVSM